MLVPLAMTHQPPQAVYIHVPFCLHRCGYCDFTLVAGRDHLIPQYLQALANELDAGIRTSRQADASGRLTVDTIFIGGGTPTHLNAQQLQELLELLQRHLRVRSGGEFTVEANPDGLDDSTLQLLHSMGVNRISLGVQSFDTATLQTLERRHTPEVAVDAVERACRQFANVSLDLIFGVPGQTTEDWKQTLATATSLPIRHISTYGLTFEQGTSFFRRASRGELERTPEEAERTQYLMSIDHLTTAGFEHYEVSNFARPGFACRHNLTYWNGCSYLAFGPGAARYIEGTRSTNSRSIPGWINHWLNHKPCVDEEETLTHLETAREAIMLALRMTRGLHLQSFEDRFGCSVHELEPVALQRHLAAGLLSLEDGWLRLTRDGLLLADWVVSDFL